MTIKQNGGIFGRNPTFNEVDATDITTESLSLLKNNPFVRLDDSDTDNNGEFRLDNTSVRIEADKDNAVAGSKIKFKIDNSEIGSFDENGHLDIDGNLIVASGQGIDFSATSGTGTSELFSDYEEGNWTLAVTGQTATATGYYTKIGDTVNCWVEFTADTDDANTNAMVFSGFPFTVNANIVPVSNITVYNHDNSSGFNSPAFASSAAGVNLVLGSNSTTAYLRPQITLAGVTNTSPFYYSNLLKVGTLIRITATYKVA